MHLRDRQHGDLLRREPRWQRGAVLLEQDPEEALEKASDTCSKPNAA